jgi:hypothetical protein
MRKTIVLVCGFVITVAVAASAQTKFSGTQKCPKSDPEYAVPVGDKPDHMMSLSKAKCAWTSGELAGVKLTDEDDTTVGDMSGTRSRDRGLGVVGMANGDKAFIQFQGATTIKDKAPVAGKGTWSFTGGTGKAKGIQGKGTYTGKFNPDGTSTYEIEGEYQVPTAAATK